MNRIDFDQTGGYRLETESLSMLQSNYKIFEALGDVVGENTIVKGCNSVGTTTTDGVIYYNGELLDFVGGQTQTKIIIVEEVTDLLFEDGQNKPTFYKRYAKFGTGVGAVLWSAFTRVYPLSSCLLIDEIRFGVFDINNLKPGWFFCDGANGTEDMRDRFPVGVNPQQNNSGSTIGDIGGAKEVVLTEPQLPSHSHTGTTNTTGAHTHTITATPITSGADRPFDGNAGEIARGTKTTSSSGNHSHTLNINTSGNNQPHENRPPFRVLGAIQFKGI